MCVLYFYISLLSHFVEISIRKYIVSTIIDCYDTRSHDTWPVVAGSHCVVVRGVHTYLLVCCVWY